MAKAMAVMRGGEYVIPEDVSEVLCDVWAHRVRLSVTARSQGLEPKDALGEVLGRILAI
jgi:MoxR-like ATPase